MVSRERAFLEFPNVLACAGEQCARSLQSLMADRSCVRRRAEATLPNKRCGPVYPKIPGLNRRTDQRRSPRTQTTA
jgi:hypothetical protein